MAAIQICVYIMTYSDNSRSWVYDTADELAVSSIAPSVQFRSCYHSRYTEWWQIQYVLRTLYIFDRLAPDDSHQNIVQLDVYRIHRFPFNVL